MQWTIAARIGCAAHKLPLSELPDYAFADQALVLNTVPGHTRWHVAPMRICDIIKEMKHSVHYLEAGDRVRLEYSEEVVGETGFEPATLWSQTRCATRLRYSPTWDHWYNNVFAAGCLPTSQYEGGGPGGTRTPDLAVMSGQL